VQACGASSYVAGDRCCAAFSVVLDDGQFAHVLRDEPSSIRALDNFDLGISRSQRTHAQPMPVSGEDWAGRERGAEHWTVREALERQGWQLVRSKRHLVYERRRLDGKRQTYVQSKTPSDRRAEHKQLTTLQRLFREDVELTTLQKLLSEGFEPAQQKAASALAGAGVKKGKKGRKGRH
jgi:hypothetical protein